MYYVLKHYQYHVDLGKVNIIIYITHPAAASRLVDRAGVVRTGRSGTLDHAADEVHGSGQCSTAQLPGRRVADVKAGQQAEYQETRV